MKKGHRLTIGSCSKEEHRAGELGDVFTGGTFKPMV